MMVRGVLMELGGESGLEESRMGWRQVGAEKVNQGLFCPELDAFCDLVPALPDSSGQDHLWGHCHFLPARCGQQEQAPLSAIHLTPFGLPLIFAK